MTLRLTSEGTRYEGWITAQVTRSLKEFSPSFTLEYVDKWAPDSQPWPLRDGDPAVLGWGSQVMLDGFIYKPSTTITGKTWKLSAAGRARTGDLVDCSVIHKTGHWTNKTATAIIKDICKPFGISVTAEVLDIDTFPRFTLREGERAYAAINRLCKMRGMLPRTSTGGDLLLWTSEAPGPVLSLDVSASESRMETSDGSQAFSEYHVNATGHGDADDSFANAVTTDASVTRYRPTVIVTDAPARSKQAEQRAIWEANVRSGRAQQLVYTFNNPLNLMGRVYSPGQQYRVRDTALGVDTVMLVEAVTLPVAAKKVTVSVTMVHPKVYSQFAYNHKKLIKKTKRKKRTKRPGGI